ncbi:MAG: hypothetical protein KC547_24240, partial [Anaerolineae bacterium]|nr:hypothetical protein [Anaerolineae bacterium]
MKSGCIILAVATALPDQPSSDGLPARQPDRNASRAFLMTVWRLPAYAYDCMVDRMDLPPSVCKRAAMCSNWP